MNSTRAQSRDWAESALLLMRRLAGRGRGREHPAPFRGLIREDNHQAEHVEHDDVVYGENDDVEDYLRVVK